jgi:hypothetical protein
LLTDDVVDAHQVRVVPEMGHNPRRDISKGLRPIERSTVLNSLCPQISKIWVCERLLPQHKGAARQLPVNCGLKLSVQRWPGAYASYPRGDFWLDVKGGYVQSNGEFKEGNKSPEERAQLLYSYGWA